MKTKKTIITFICSLLIVVIHSCKPYEKIGRFKYYTKTETIFTGDYGAALHKIKSYYFKGKPQAGGILKSWLGFDSMVDSTLSTGFSEIDEVNNRLIFKEYYFHGYKETLKVDSIIKIYKQQPKGNLKIILYKQYYNGIAEDVEIIQ